MMAKMMMMMILPNRESAAYAKASSTCTLYTQDNLQQQCKLKPLPPLSSSGNVYDISANLIPNNHTGSGIGINTYTSGQSLILYDSNI